jgi:hypothetical protein
MGVGQPASTTDALNGFPLGWSHRSRLNSSDAVSLFQSRAAGVGQPLRCPIQSLSDVRRTEARRAGIDRPEGVTLAFHVRLNNVEPSKSVLARNLFAKASDRAEDFDEVVDERA